MLDHKPLPPGALGTLRAVLEVLNGAHHQYRPEAMAEAIGAARALLAHLGEQLGDRSLWGLIHGMAAAEQRELDARQVAAARELRAARRAAGRAPRAGVQHKSSTAPRVTPRK